METYKQLVREEFKCLLFSYNIGNNIGGIHKIATENYTMYRIRDNVMVQQCLRITDSRSIKVHLCPRINILRSTKC